MFYSVGIFVLSLIARSFLFCIGWSGINQEISNRLNKYDRSVAVFSHTTYIDFYIFILYLCAYPQQLRYIRTVVKPQPFKYAGWLLRRLGAIPATAPESNNEAAVDRIIEELRSDNKSILLI